MTLEEAIENVKNMLMENYEFTEEDAYKMIEIIKEYAIWCMKRRKNDQN